MFTVDIKANSSRLNRPWRSSMTLMRPRSAPRIDPLERRIHMFGWILTIMPLMLPTKFGSTTYFSWLITDTIFFFAILKKNLLRWERQEYLKHFISVKVIKFIVKQFSPKRSQFSQYYMKMQAMIFHDHKQKEHRD